MVRTPKINPKADGNSIDFVSMNLMIHNFVSKELCAKAFKNERLLIYLGKIVILENVISYYLAYYLRALQNRINDGIALKKNQIRTDNPLELLGSDKTLGYLIENLERYSPRNKMLKKLKRFNASRNKFTHYLHLGFSDNNRITIEARSLSTIGIKIIGIMMIEYKKISTEFKVRVPKVFKIEKIINFEKEKKKAKFPNYLDVSNNLKKFNSTQKISKY